MVADHLGEPSGDSHEEACDHDAQHRTREGGSAMREDEAVPPPRGSLTVQYSCTTPLVYCTTVPVKECSSDADLPISFLKYAEVCSPRYWSQRLTPQRESSTAPDRAAKEMRVFELCVAGWLLATAEAAIDKDEIKSLPGWEGALQKDLHYATWV